MSEISEIAARIERLLTGEEQLDSDGYRALLEAVRETALVLHHAPRGIDPQATGIWYHHERTPALTQLHASLCPRAEDRIETLAAADHRRAEEARVIRELHAAITATPAGGKGSHGRGRL